MNQNRVASGVPSGGQYAATRRDRSAVSLDAGAEVEVPREIVEQIEAEAVEMPYGYGKRYVSARLNQERARIEAEALAEAARPVARRSEDIIPEEADPEIYLANGVPVPADHPAFQEGQVVDMVDVDGTIYHRAREGVHFNQPYSMMPMADRPISDEEMQQMASLAGYAYRTTVHGESLDAPERISPHAFTLYADTTKGGGYIGDFISSYPRMAQEGSPVRTTNRASAGTQGTRLVIGMAENTPSIEMFFDEAPQTS